MALEGRVLIQIGTEKWGTNFEEMTQIHRCQVYVEEDVFMLLIPFPVEVGLEVFQPRRPWVFNRFQSTCF